MKKRILSAVLAFCVLLALRPAPARAAKIVASGGCGAENEEDLIWTLDENGLLTFTGSGAMADYGNSNAPWYFFQTQAVSLPSGLTNIGSYAFYSLGGITEIAIPDTVTSIGECAFAYSDNLSYVSLPEGLDSVGASAFFCCSNLTSLTIPGSVTEIGESAFANSPELTATVYEGSYGQRYCELNSVRHVVSGNESTVYVASGSCGENLIWTLDSAGNLTFTGSGAMADYGNSNTPWYFFQIQTVSLPSGLTNIGSYAFYGLGGITEIAIPDTVTSIGEWVFAYSDNLSSVSLPEGLTSIGANAFFGCSNLTSLTIPRSVTEIGVNAFSSFDYSDLTVTVYEGSYGQRYCLLNNVPHNAVDPNTYTITFHPNGGDGEPTTKTLTGIDAVYGELPTPTRDGYAFMGWHTATDYGDKITPDTKFEPRRSQTLYAVWAKPYAITFDPNGGEAPQTSKILTDADAAYGELPTPTRDGYAFEGWHTAAKGGTLVTADTEFADKRNQTLYAVWKEIKATYEVTLEANGGTVEPSSVTVEEGGAYGALPEPSRDGCAFLGWHTEPSGGTQVKAETPVRLTANQTLYAHWIATNAPEFSSNGAAVTDVREMSSETDLEGKFTVPDAENPDAFRTATAFCVLYDKDGLMVHLQSWDVDVSDVRNIRFTGSVRIPEGAQVSEIKIIVLSDELVPLQAAGML